MTCESCGKDGAETKEDIVCCQLTDEFLCEECLEITKQMARDGLLPVTTYDFL